MKGNRWDDTYARRARKEKWLARSVYKLQEIDKKYRLIRKGGRLLDLGCYPGSWSQYGIKKIGPQGEVVGVDIHFPDRLTYPNFRFIQGDALTIQTEWLAREISPRDLVMSDLAPQTTGISVTDVNRSMILSRRAAECARALLKEKGHFVCKVFEGEDMMPFRSEITQYFRNVKAIRPKATRKGSKEIYLVGLELLRRRT